MKEAVCFFLSIFFGILTLLSLLMFAIGVIELFGMAVGIIAVSQTTALNAAGYAVTGMIMSLVTGSVTLVFLDES